MMLAALASNWTASASVAADSFSNTGSLKFPRHYHTATLLPNGKVLAAAGEETGNLGSVTVVTAELYDPFTAK